ncbi:tripartite tricarboxylate transporter TctB family protein [Vibrio sp. JC009]|uniref:tripartite tricarboxylate transporter TctB family protein n=1 Tax=Vibrio sp. JC009 TaxID=2912314 RepID=UPI0023AF7D01|nr:tripartite tricarboxylate transporter TctB family protein [Vibrio sp. JC009]WED23895.1 tripartite tricarboxylate transporter TctB family protein [Vibrio sp. JC009]
MGEIIFHVFLLAVMGIFFNESLDINTARMTDPIGPAGFPQAVIILAVLLLIPSLFKAFKKYKESGSKGGKIQELDPGFLSLLAIIVVFVLCIDYVGFWFGAVVIISSVMFILNERQPKKLVLTTVIASLAFTFVFGNILSIPLPRGYGLFETISYLLY